ncbi:MAG: hypothetical protein WCS43_13390 [Verrucomicrobiota bacterium]
MNTNPDETKLACWLEDELAGEELTSFETWLRGQPDHAEHLAMRDNTRNWRSIMASAMPSSEEPPYPDFFNSRVAQSIRENRPQSVVAEKTRFSWRALLMPTTACAGMVLAFWLGTRSQPAPLEIDVTWAPRAIPVSEQSLYTPESGVVAECFSSTGAAATVIVLDGVEAIPDDTDFSETVFMKTAREIDATAGVEVENDGDQEL